MKIKCRTATIQRQRRKTRMLTTFPRMRPRRSAWTARRTSTTRRNTTRKTIRTQSARKRSTSLRKMRSYRYLVRLNLPVRKFRESRPKISTSTRSSSVSSLIRKISKLLAKCSVRTRQCSSWTAQFTIKTGYLYQAIR